MRSPNRLSWLRLCHIPPSLPLSPPAPWLALSGFTAAAGNGKRLVSVFVHSEEMVEPAHPPALLDDVERNVRCVGRVVGYRVRVSLLLRADCSGNGRSQLHVASDVSWLPSDGVVLLAKRLDLLGQGTRNGFRCPRALFFSLPTQTPHPEVCLSLPISPSHCCALCPRFIAAGLRRKGPSSTWQRSHGSRSLPSSAHLITWLDATGVDVVCVFLSELTDHWQWLVRV